MRLRENATGRELVFANTHFDHKGVVARQEASRVISRRLSEIGRGVPAILTGFALTATGLDRSLGGNQPAGTILWLRLVYLVVPILGVSLTLVALHFFPLTEARSRDIRRELERRRGTGYAR